MGPNWPESSAADGWAWQGGFEVEMSEPYSIFTGLPLPELESLRADITSYVQARHAPTRSEMPWDPSSRRRTRVLAENHCVANMSAWLSAGACTAVALRVARQLRCCGPVRRV